MTYSLHIGCDTTTKSNLENINDNIIQLHVHLAFKYKSLTKNNIVCVFLEFNVIMNTVSLEIQKCNEVGTEGKTSLFLCCRFERNNSIRQNGCFFFYFSVLYELDKSNERGLRRHLVKWFSSKSNLKVESELCSFTNCLEGGYKHIIMMSYNIIHDRTTQCWMWT